MLCRGFIILYGHWCCDNHPRHPCNTGQYFAHSAERAWEASLPDSEAEKGCKDTAYQLVKDSPGNDIQVVLGGGRRNFMPDTTADPEYPDKYGKRIDGQNLIDDWLKSKAGSSASYVWNEEDFNAVDPTKTDYLLGLFEPSHMKYENAGTNEPSLAQMVDKAIKILEKDEGRFFLLVEGGRIDHGHHDGRALDALVDGTAFEEAIAKSGELVSDDDTLTIVTADHSFSFNILGYPGRGNPILGVNDLEKDLDGLPFTTLNYPGGPSADDP